VVKDGSREVHTIESRTGEVLVGKFHHAAEIRPRV
jgi:hypothetical protein